MKHFRLYKLDRKGGSIVKAKDLVVPDDSVAKEVAKEDDDCPDCEVWQGTERVAVV